METLDVRKMRNLHPLTGRAMDVPPMSLLRVFDFLHACIKKDSRRGKKDSIDLHFCSEDLCMNEWIHSH
uniref:Uncharacterized protein n=1 Tax=Acrobeloides nanus TaxID=290746 RepID=A0A914CA30_9BILA